MLYVSKTTNDVSFMRMIYYRREIFIFDLRSSPSCFEQSSILMMKTVL